MAISFVALALTALVGVIIITPFLWLAGRILVGGKAKVSDAVWIVLLGTIVGGIVGGYLSGLLGALVQLVLWLALIKHFFDCGWLKAFAISLVAAVIFFAIALVLGLIGLSFILL